MAHHHLGEGTSVSVGRGLRRCVSDFLSTNFQSHFFLSTLNRPGAFRSFGASFPFSAFLSSVNALHRYLLVSPPATCIVAHRNGRVCGDGEYLGVSRTTVIYYSSRPMVQSRPKLENRDARSRERQTSIATCVTLAIVERTSWAINTLPDM